MSAIPSLRDLDFDELRETVANIVERALRVDEPTRQEVLRNLVSALRYNEVSLPDPSRKN